MSFWMQKATKYLIWWVEKRPSQGHMAIKFQKYGYKEDFLEASRKKKQQKKSHARIWTKNGIQPLNSKTQS